MRYCTKKDGDLEEDNAKNGNFKNEIPENYTDEGIDDDVIHHTIDKICKTNNGLITKKRRKISEKINALGMMGHMLFT